MDSAAGPTADHDPAAVAATLSTLGAATLGESGARRMAPRIRPAWAGAAVAGRAYPVRCTPGDNLAIHVATARAPEGSVLVVDVGNVADRGYWGEVLTRGAQARGLVGLVIDGGVRDVGALAERGFPAFSALIALTGASKESPGTIGAAVVVGGVTVEAGDWVVGDVDGVVVVPAAHLDDVLEAGAARTEKELGFFAALAAGETTLSLLHLDASSILES